MPKAYDGLALAANILDKNKRVVFEIQEEVDYSERYILDVEEGNEPMEPADFYIITLSEIIAQLKNE